ncbi:MAG: hypothetical protein E7J99_03170 [Clostridium butyricum]|uniref:hypothetical protein n=1 Tax=Clostridium sp. TaxID=1506 RepID=UPI00290045F1|nr:hypothetical protein [Clostridium sp.]MDU1115192.1 hypothetical protein [Clostridium sp.]MDU7711128.1 hypothetical protein [Clostridium butyricum]
MNYKKITSMILSLSILGTIGSGTVASAAELPPEIPSGGMPEGEMPPGGFNVNKGSEVESTGVLLVDGTTETKSDVTLTAYESNESPVKVTNGGSLKLSDSELVKSSGEMTVEEASDFFGANAGFLASEGSTATIENTTITTTASGGNAVFATGEGTKVNLNNVTINTTKDHSRGLDATYQGEINADTVKINTAGSHCAAVATDRGEGTVNVTNSELNTRGEGSPCVYSTGDINVSNTTGLATGSSLAVIEGKNSIELDNCDLTAYAIGRGNGGVDDTGVMVYQSMSGDADNGVGTFSVKDSSLTISEDSSKYETAPMFFVTNTDAVINVENTQLSFGSKVLLNASGNNGEWGKAGSNAGNVQFNAVNQNLEGEITVDNISSAHINLSSSTLTSTINTANTAKEVNLKLDESSIWNVTGTSYISSLSDDDATLSNIKDNGNTIYYDINNADNTWLNGETVELNDGGKLVPIEMSSTSTSFSESSDSKDGWKIENNKWYFNSYGQYKKGWYKDTNSKWYMFDNSTGEMITGWFKDSDGSWYYLKDNGEMACNESVDGYYLGADGVMEK